MLGTQRLTERSGEEKNLALPRIDSKPSRQKPVVIPTEATVTRDGEWRRRRLCSASNVYTKHL
jgi:hypothetical protein